MLKPFRLVSVDISEKNVVLLIYYRRLIWENPMSTHATLSEYMHANSASLKPDDYMKAM